ncbi:MAG: DNA polymerase III subunit beta [Elusimicrobia bacterium]|nr:DNA polymerase III subunit beta [Elusimicrobiota bacterium]
MKIKLNTNDFSNLLTTVLPAISTRSTLPSLSHFLIDADKDKIKVYATDLEIGIESSISSKEIEKEGALTIPARNLTDIIRVIDSDSVTLNKVKEGKVEISSDDSNTKFNIVCGESEDYPGFPEMKEDRLISIDAKSLKEGIEKTLPSVSKDESRYILCGIYFENDGKELKMVSTDGRRLSYYKGKVKGNSSKFKAIIPTKAINVLEKTLTDEDESVKISINSSENQIYFSFGNTIIYSRLIEGDYPNYGQVIPENTTKNIIVGTEEVLNATKKMIAATVERTTPVKFLFRSNKAVISLQAADGSGTSTIPVQYKGDEIEIAFNPEFIINALRVVRSDKVKIGLTTPINPGKIAPESDTELYIGVIMPMRP